jgi:TonB family protein
MRLRAISLLLLILALAAAPALAFAADAPPEWLRKPRTDDLLTVWPRGALSRGVGGKAVLVCTVTIEGALRNCGVASETPPGEDFGAAAMAMTGQFVMRPAMKDGKPVEARASFTIDFPEPALPYASHIKGYRYAAMYSPEVMLLPWVEAPSFADVLAAYPEKARAEKVSGKASFDCTVLKTGRLYGCDLLGDDPRGYGFGKAAHGLMSKFLSPQTGRPPTGQHVQVPVTFSVDALNSPNPVIGRPNWTALPAPEDLAAVYPAAASKAGVLKARVVLLCGVGTGGGLSDCRWESEDPPGYGLGQATINLVKTFRLSVWSAEGLPVIGGTVRVPIRYDMSEAPPPAAKP